jgi:uncharacterized protein with HEPN domain
MSEHHDIVYIKIIFDYIEKIEKFTYKINFNGFQEDDKTIDAVLLNLAQIGEIANKLSEEFKDAHKKIDWFKIRGLRNRIMHDYRNTDLQIVWKIIQEDIPELKSYIEKII